MIVDRQIAARELGVSIRTVDRYIKIGKLTAKKSDKKIVIDNDSFLRFKQQYIPKKKYIKVIQKIENLNSQKFVNDTIDERENYYGKIKDVKLDYMSIPPLTGEKNITTREFLLSTVDDLKKQIKVYEEKLQGANYRVGQLEGELKNCIVLPKYKQELLQNKNIQLELKNRLNAEAQRNSIMIEQINKEKFRKLLYMIVLFLLMLSQPILWILLR